MPTPTENETKEEFMERCMSYPDMQKYESDQRAAICNSKWENKATASFTTQTTTQQYAMFTEPMQIAEDVSCCLKVNAVIAKEGIFTFPIDGRNQQCLWSRQELLKATRTARAAKITIKDHPPNQIVTSQDEIYGTVEKPFFDRDRIRADLSFDKDITPPDFLESIRAAAAKEGAPKDVSIGFYYNADMTPGLWHGQPYDLVMRNIVIDHVATGVWRGRCSYPNCGIGVSSIQMAAFIDSQSQKNIKGMEVKKTVSEEEKQQPTEEEKDEHGCVIGKEKWDGEKCVLIEEKEESPPAEASAPKLSSASLIQQNRELLGLKQERGDAKRIERLRELRRNPLA